MMVGKTDEHAQAVIDRAELAADVSQALQAIAYWQQMALGGPGGTSETWRAENVDAGTWFEVVESLTIRLRKALGRPMPCDFCHGAGTIEVDAGGPEPTELDCQRCFGDCDGKPWPKEGEG